MSAPHTAHGWILDRYNTRGDGAGGTGGRDGEGGGLAVSYRNSMYTVNNVNSINV